MSEKTLNVMQVAEKMSCSRSHVYRLIDSGELTAYRTGKRKGLRILVSSVEAFVDKQKAVYAVAS